MKKDCNSRQKGFQPISEAKQKIIKERMNEPGLTRRALASELGISVATVYSYVKLFGGQLDYTKSKRQQGVADMIRRYYPHYTDREIMEMKPEGISLSKTRISCWANRLGVKHTPETLQRIKEMRIANIRGVQLKANQAKRVAAWKRTRRMEEFRVMSGMPQKTKLKIKTVPERCSKAAWTLEHKRKYILTTDPYLIWYDKNTLRSPMESHYERRCGFRFEAAQD